MLRHRSSPYNGLPQKIRRVLHIGIGILIGSTASGIVGPLPSLQAQSSSPLTIQPDTGRIGIGTTAPTAKLDVAGTAQIANWASQTLAQNGFARVGSVLYQWGFSPAGLGYARNISFPTAFSQVYSVTATWRPVDMALGGAGSLTVAVYNISTTAFSVETRCTNNAGCDAGVMWIAIGT